MKAIAIVPERPDRVWWNGLSPPITTQDEIKIRIIRVGICGTRSGRSLRRPRSGPDGQKELVIGHEMLAK